MAAMKHPDPIADQIHQAWKRSGLSIEEVAFRWRVEAVKRGMTKETGLRGHGAIKSWCYGWTIPQLHQYRVLAHVLNEEIEEEPFRLPDLTYSYASFPAAVGF